MKSVVVSAGLDDLRTPDIRFLNEASELGPLHVLLWSDELIQKIEGKAPKFSLTERQYFVDAMRCVSRISITDQLPDADQIPENVMENTAIWTVRQAADSLAKQQFCAAHGLKYSVIGDEKLKGFPPLPHERKARPTSPKKKVVVTGCYDWFHTGHVRFFEEVSDYGELYVCVGNDANLLHLKGPGHPHFPQDERRYIVGSVRFVHEAIISTGSGWMDAEPEIIRIRPDIYAVNEDGDKPEKRAFCEKHGMEYLVLKRLPKPGLTRRSSTALRGF